MGSAGRLTQAMKLEKLRPGIVVYDCHSYKMGNTNLRSLGIWMVRIESVDLENKTVVASWNGNPVKKYYESDARKWKEKRPVLVSGIFGSKRRATREELKAIKEGDKP